MTELPIACTLSAEELPDRLRAISALGRQALLDVDVARARARLRFAADRGVRERVERIVAAESRCCAFLTMSVEADPQAGAVVLTIAAPEGAELVVAELVQAFTGGSPGRSS